LVLKTKLNQSKSKAKVLSTHAFSVMRLALFHFKNLKWKRISAENGDYYVVYADIINKITQSNGKVS